MKINHDIEKEKETMEKTLLNIKKNPKQNLFLDIIDKAALIEKIWSSIEKGKEITIKIDEDSKDYPNILSDTPPRFILQDNGNTLDLAQYLKTFSISLFKEKNEYFLKIKKTSDEPIDLRLKLDRDKTIDLKLLSPDKTKKDKIYFGVKSYYYIRKN